ncbi:Bni5 [Kluyveromyces lactis]|nr:Bni5 [Kluyveromyces lactis]
MDSEQVKKRMSQIELEISEMNEMIDKNLSIHETTVKTKQDVSSDDQDEDYLELQKLTANQVDQFVQNAIKSDGEDEVPETLSNGRETALQAEEREDVKEEQPDTQPEAEVAAAVVAEVQTEVQTEPSAEKAVPAVSVTSVPAKRIPSEKIEVSTSTEEDEVAAAAAAATVVPNTDKSSTYPAPAAIGHTQNGTLPRAPNTESSNIPTSPRILTPKSNPFRVVHVGSQPSSRNASRNSSRVSSTSSDISDINFEQLQQNYNSLSVKCTKLQKEIDYLHKFQHESTLTLEDRRKLITAIEKLQEYLDKKNKQRYDTGVILSRQIRKNVDMGANGQFWVGRS